MTSMGDLNEANFSTPWQWPRRVDLQLRRTAAWGMVVHKSCTFANLNGKYMEDGGDRFSRGLLVLLEKLSVLASKKVEMKIRPLR